VLFSGTVRKCLDPFGSHSDDQITSALAKVLGERAPELDAEVADGGARRRGMLDARRGKTSAPFDARRG